MPTAAALRFLAAFLAFAPALGMAQDWALGGMDPVAYQTEGAPMPGRSDVVTEWHGRSWHFVSEQNRARFEANPRAFAPAFDGYCVISLSEGRLEPGNPSAFLVYEGKLYLMRSASARDQFLSSAASVLALAKQNFARLR